MNDKKISIIVPVFRVENYIDQCVSSIVNQSYKNLEIILVDDGSPDQCGYICDEYAKADKRIKVVHKENGGLSSARNAGLDIASGDYIGFVDSDDWIHQKMYEILIDTAILENSDIVECKFINVYDRNIPNSMNDTRELYTCSNVQALANHFHGKYFYRCVWSKIYRKHLFDHTRFPIGKLAEDLFVSHELFFQAQRVSHVDFTGYYYYQRPDSIMGKNGLKLMADSLDGMKAQHQFICERAPILKKYVDKLYLNCLLKSFVYFEKHGYTGMAESYRSHINTELNRNDIGINGISKILHMLYKFSPKILSDLMEFQNKGRNWIKKYI